MAIARLTIGEGNAATAAIAASITDDRVRIPRGKRVQRAIAAGAGAAAGGPPRHGRAGIARHDSSASFVDGNFNGFSTDYIAVVAETGGNHTINASGVISTSHGLVIYAEAGDVGGDTIEGGSGGKNALAISDRGTADLVGVTGIGAFYLYGADKVAFANATFTGVSSADIAVIAETGGDTIDGTGITSTNEGAPCASGGNGIYHCQIA